MKLDDVKTGSLRDTRISSDGTCLQAEWHPVWRRRELDSGFHVQSRRGGIVPMVREKFKWRTHKNESTDAEHRGGPPRSSAEGR